MSKFKTGTLHPAGLLLILIVLASVAGAFLRSITEGGDATALAASSSTGDEDPLLPAIKTNEPLPGDANDSADLEASPELFPASLLQLPPQIDTALVSDLINNRMYAYERSADHFVKVGDFFVAVGKQGLDKQREGDERTPIGIYFPESFIPGNEIPSIYGAGAFPITYPNTWDKAAGRTGSGIWIHGTDKDDNTLLPLSSRGCLTLRDADFLELAKLIHLEQTPVIIAKAVDWTSIDEIRKQRELLAAAVEAWRQDWESLETARYLQHYSPSFTSGRMNFDAWAAYKKRVNKAKSFIQVELKDIGIYRYPGERGLFMVTFHQEYNSNNYKMRMSKQQFWQNEDGTLRILHEGPG